MIRWRSIGFRLAAWYTAVLAAALAIFGGGMWLTLRASLYAAVDHSLRDRVAGLAGIIEEHGAFLPRERMLDEIREHLALVESAELFQVSDGSGKWLYRSPALEAAHLPARPAAVAGTKEYEDIRVRRVPLRVLHATIDVRGNRYCVQAATPTHQMRESLLNSLWLLVAAIPLILALASAGGYWISRRALAPVDEITNAARSISERNLSRRLAVPETRDELQRLSETLNEMFQRLESAFDRIAQFTADASHELRAPLAFMRTAAEVALRKQRPALEYRETLAQIHAELERTSRLVDDLLLLARADSGAQTKFGRTNLTDTVREVCEQGRLLAESRQLSYHWEAPDPPIEIEGDSQAIRRVCLILIDNAVKFTGPGGEVDVRLIRRDRFAVVEVRDSGAGIPERDLPHIFDRFYRADKARSRHSGVGLGLAIARSIVAAHHGEIRVTSQPGCGSQFQVLLPIAN